jgi:hypothetical protein
VRADNTVRWNVIHPVPQNWKLASGDVWTLPATQAENAGYWANAIYPYSKNWSLMTLNAGTAIRNAADAADFAAPAATPAKVSATYNGLLHTLSMTSINAVSAVSLLWNGTGKSDYEGRAISNPALNCSVAPYNTPQTCVFGASSGPSFAWFWIGGSTVSAFVFTNGFNHVRADSSAKFVRAGRVTGSVTVGSEPNRDYFGTPFAHILAGGVPETMWGCNLGGTTPSLACFFRPDREN